MLKDVFGYSAGFIAAIMYFPQIKKMYITKSTDDLSMNTIFLLIICSILDSYFEYNFIIKYTILFFNLVFIIFFNYRRKKIIREYNQNLNESTFESTFESIELNTIV